MRDALFYCTGRKETLYEKKPLTSHATCNIRRSPAWFSIRPPAVSGASKKFVSKFVSNSRNRLFRAKGKPRKTLIFRGFLESMRLDLNQRPLRVVPVPEIQYLCGFSGTHFETQPLTQPPQILIWLSNTMRRRKFTASIRPGEIRVCSCLDPLVILHR